MFGSYRMKNCSTFNTFIVIYIPPNNFIGMHNNKQCTNRWRKPRKIDAIAVHRDNITIVCIRPII